MDLSGVRAQTLMAEAGGVHPFALFPEEIWSLIAEMLMDSSEILKLINAIPELEVAVGGRRRRYWLFDQIIPHLLEWLANDDILTCREVCRQWFHGVDNFVVNHPQFRPYDHDNQVTGQIWTIDGRPAHIYGNSRVPVPASYFDSLEMINDFFQRMGDVRRGRHPFIDRCVFIDSTTDIQILTGTSDIIRRFGRDIWFLNWFDYLHHNPELLCVVLRDWLGQLPNLKSLRLSIPMLPPLQFVQALDDDGVDDDETDSEDEDEDVDEAEQIIQELIEPDVNPGMDEAEAGELRNLQLAQMIWDLEEADDIMDGDEVEEAQNVDSDSDSDEEIPELIPEPVQPLGYLDRWKEPLPPLPQLESIEIYSRHFPPAIISALVSSYSNQIRRLGLSTPLWKPDFFTTFPNLTEIYINRISSKVELKSIIFFLQAPLLYSLELGFYWAELEMGTDIFPWLRRFPLIRNLCLKGQVTVRGSSQMFSPATCPILSLKYLHIGAHFLHANSDFLLCFPNLEHLHIGARQAPLGAALEPTVKLRKFIQNRRLYESNLWELLPKLEGLTLIIIEMILDDMGDEEEVDRELRFNRPAYNYQKKVAAKAN